MADEGRRPSHSQVLRRWAGDGDELAVAVSFGEKVGDHDPPGKVDLPDDDFGPFLASGNREVGHWGEEGGSADHAGRAKAGTGIKAGVCGLVPNLEMEVGRGAFRVTAVAVPPEELAGEDERSVAKTGGEGVAVAARAVVSAGGVVVDVVVLGCPAVDSYEGDRVARVPSVAAKVDDSVEHGNQGEHFWAENVFATVAPGTSAPACQKRGPPSGLAEDGEDEGDDYIIAADAVVFAGAKAGRFGGVECGAVGVWDGEDKPGRGGAGFRERPVDADRHARLDVSEGEPTVGAVGVVGGRRRGEGDGFDGGVSEVSLGPVGGEHGIDFDPQDPSLDVDGLDSAFKQGLVGGGRGDGKTVEASSGVSGRDRPEEQGGGHEDRAEEGGVSALAGLTVLDHVVSYHFFIMAWQGLGKAILAQ